MNSRLDSLREGASACAGATSFLSGVGAGRRAGVSPPSREFTRRYGTPFRFSEDARRRDIIAACHLSPVPTSRAEATKTREYSQTTFPARFPRCRRDCAPRRRLRHCDAGNRSAGRKNAERPTALQAAAVISASLLLAKVIGAGADHRHQQPDAAGSQRRVSRRVLKSSTSSIIWWRGGAMSLTFIPIFTELRLRDGASTRKSGEDAWRFFFHHRDRDDAVSAGADRDHVFRGAAHHRALFVGFSTKKKRALTVSMLRIMLPAQWAFLRRRHNRRRAQRQQAIRAPRR